MQRQVLQVEKFLAIAAQALSRSAVVAESMRDQGLADDLHQLHVEVLRIIEALLTSRRRRSVSSGSRAYQ